MSGYFLTSARLAFRPWQQEDLELAAGLWGDAEVTRLIGGELTPAQIAERLACEISLNKQYGVQYWPVFLSASGDHVGCCGLRPYRPAESIYELGFHLRRAYWGQGLAKEAAQAVIHYAFNSLPVRALFAGHNPANESSRTLLKKLGFRYTHDEFYAPTGLYHPSYLLLKEKFV